ncbi:hypothetical protein BV898_06601 [Hypsibius exemplaris]|uniref:Transcription cofactor vestigial-like protein 2 n=1 Tax=Hypsibius exemplaris TaxID=2072580 RepID=A0A1W0WVY3_HYPEX|nr:hypothetical protein BV898_06601 [Hypsibius exemplaris]
MSCVDVMYQNSLSSCFPAAAATPFPGGGGSNYAGSNGVPYHGSLSSSSSSKMATTSSGDPSLKKIGSAKMYADRYGYSSSSSSNNSRYSDCSAAPAASSGSGHSSNSFGATSTHSSRVGLCGSSDSAGRSSNSNRSSKADTYFRDEKPPIVQLTSVTETVLTYHSLDVPSAVDDHFSRAIDIYYGKGAPAGIPMKNRNLPPSFYDPNVSAPASLPQQCHSATTTTAHYGFPYHHSYPSTPSNYGYADPYSYPSFHHPGSFHHPPADTWNYTAAAAYNSVAAQKAAMDFTANHFNSSSYNSLVSQAIYPAAPVGMRSNRTDASGGYKPGASWPAHSVFGSEMSHYPSTEYDHSFSGKTQSAKELYWHSHAQ